MNRQEKILVESYNNDLYKNASTVSGSGLYCNQRAFKFCLTVISTVSYIKLSTNLLKAS